MTSASIATRPLGGLRLAAAAALLAIGASLGFGLARALPSDSGSVAPAGAITPAATPYVQGLSPDERQEINDARYARHRIYGGLSPDDRDELPR
jgi:hypothetical protein